MAGTNGKGSSVALLEACLRSAGYTTGSYTSPHLVRYNERIRVNQRPLPDEAICHAFEQIEGVRKKIRLTYFEFGTLAALVSFVHAQVDVAILEVGLGGRLDAVNIIDADAVLIASVDLDHQHWLGPDRESIGREKAGVIRTGRPVVYSSDDPTESIAETAKALSAPLYVLGRDYRFTVDGKNQWKWYGPDKKWYQLPFPALEGEHQLRNAAGVVMLLQTLAPLLEVDHSALTSGLKRVTIQGRTQHLAGDVDWIVDVGHNPHAINVLRDQLLKRRPPGKIRAVFGMLKDKDISAVVSILDDVVDEWHLADLSSSDPRGSTADRLQSELVSAGIRSPWWKYPAVAEALQFAMSLSSDQDLILVTGSFHTAGEALKWREYNRDKYHFTG